MNIFSSDTFLAALGEAYFRDRQYEPALFAVEGRPYRLLVVDGAPIARWQFVDFFEPVVDPEGFLRPLGYLPKVARETFPAEAWISHPPKKGVFPSPFIDWSHFARWDDFRTLVSSRIHNLFPDSRRQRNKLARTLGAVEFRLDDRRPEVLELGMKWKGAQYRASGWEDLFADPKNRQLFIELRARELLLVSTLSAGEEVIAVHLGAIYNGRLYWWIPSYNRELGKFSPGRLMMESLIRTSFERGDKEFDFLIGDDAYKWHYATHVRVIGSVGVPPLS